MKNKWSRQLLRVVGLGVLVWLPLFGGNCKETDAVDELDECYNETERWEAQPSFPGEVTYSQVNGTTRTIIFDQKGPTDICVNRELSFLATAQIDSKYKDSVTCAAHYYYGILGSTFSMPYSAEESLFKGTSTNGIQDGFPKSPGSLNFQVRITFPTRGSDALDNAYFSQIITYTKPVYMLIEYHRPNPKK